MLLLDEELVVVAALEHPFAPARHMPVEAADRALSPRHALPVSLLWRAASGPPPPRTEHAPTSLRD